MTNKTNHFTAKQATPILMRVQAMGAHAGRALTMGRAYNSPKQQLRLFYASGMFLGGVWEVEGYVWTIVGENCGTCLGGV